MKSDLFKPCHRLRAARKASGYKSASSFCEAHDINYGTYAAHEGGKRTLTKKAAEKYGPLLNIAPVWLLTGEEESSIAPTVTRSHDENGYVLLIEDDIVLQSSIEIMLRKYHLKTIFSGSSKEALDKIHEHAYCLILVDLGLPDQSGLSTIEAIRQLEEDNNNVRRPIVVITAHGDELTQESAYEAGADEFIVKPLNKNKIIQLLDRYIKK